MPLSIPLEEIFIGQNATIISSNRDRGWRDLGVFRARTHGGVLHIAAPPQHWLTVRFGPEPTQLEACSGRTMSRSVHTRGVMSLIPAGVETHWQFELPTDDIVLVLPPSLLARVAADNDSDGGVELVPSSGTYDPQVERFALLLNGELEGGGPNGRLFGESLATALAVHLLTRHAVCPVKLKEYDRGLSKSELAFVLSYITDGLLDNISLTDIAACVSLSPDYFGRLFRQSTGMPVHRYIIQQRVERAKSLLSSPGLSIGEVAAAVGFYDHSQLSKHFKAATGVTAGEFIRRDRR